MKLIELAESTINELKKIECDFAVCGGLAADLYRKISRVTRDIDFLLLAGGAEVEKGRGVLKALGLGVGEVKLHQLNRAPRMNRKSQKTYILVGRNEKEDMGVDLLLPPFPWFANALKRAKHNLVDFGFGEIPTLTPEDVILAKLHANRPKDIDDVISILESGRALDSTYLQGELDRMNLTLPKEVVKIAPPSLRRFAKRAVPKKKSFP